LASSAEHSGHSSVLFIDRAAVLLNNDRHNPKPFNWR
jgi:hypothetical protein